MARKCIEDPWKRQKGGGRKQRSGYFPFLWQNILFKKKKHQQQANINFCNSYKRNSREKNPWSATRPLISNWTESFKRILICFRGYHQSYYPPDLCHHNRLSYSTASPQKRCDKSSKWIGRSAAAHSLQCQQHTRDASSQKHQVLSSQIHLAARKAIIQLLSPQ